MLLFAGPLVTEKIDDFCWIKPFRAVAQIKAREPLGESRRRVFADMQKFSETGKV